MMLIRQIAFLVLLVHSASAAPEIFLSPTGRGAQDGTSFADASAAAKGGLQRAWDALEDGGTLWLAADEYPDFELTIPPAAASSRGLRTLRGQITDGRRAVLLGRFDPEQPARTDSVAIKAMEGAGQWAVRDLDFRRIGHAIHARGGQEDVAISGLRVFGAREGIRLEGKGKAGRGSQRITISDCRFEGFTKNGIRLAPGSTDVRMEKCVADAGGRAWMKEKFHMGFFVESDCDQIVFTECEARRCYDDAGTGYWNADGFCVERAGHVRWERCRAFDCTDGGWDSKAAQSELIDCVAARNKRNFRFWGGATLTNCLSVHPMYPGASGGELALWSSGQVIARQCSFVGSSLLENSDGGSIRLERSLLVDLRAGAGEKRTEGFTLVGCRESAVEESSLSQVFRKPSRDFEWGNGFDPLDPTIGFVSP